MTSLLQEKVKGYLLPGSFTTCQHLPVSIYITECVGLELIASFNLHNSVDIKYTLNDRGQTPLAEHKIRVFGQT